MSGLTWRQRLGRIAVRRRDRAGASTPTPAPTPAHRVVASGLLDRAYYELQTGRSFPDDEAAARDFLQQGHRLGLSPHPLFEPEWFRRERPKNRPNTLLAYLDGAGDEDPGPLFGEQSYLERFPDAARHPGRALGHFVARAGDDEPLPAPTGHGVSLLTWGQARDIAYASAREFRRFEDLRSTPRRGPWDEAADQRFVAEWLRRGEQPDPGPSPRVTVVMPVRNRPVQVLEAIASVREQTLPDWELVVVDDGSTDDTADVVAGIAAADPRVRLVRQPPSGVCAARNAGIAAARGEWLAFLDSDNTWVPHFLQVMVGDLESRGLRAGHAVIDTMVESDEEGQGRYLAFDGGLDHLLVRNHIDLNGFMARTAVITEVGGFDESLRRWVDHDLAIRVARVTDVPLVPFVGVRYDHRLDSADRITTTEPDSWEWVVLAKHHVDWDAVAAAAHERDAGLVSICMPSLEDWAYTRVAIDAVLAAADRSPDLRIELVLVINGARRCVATILRSLYAADPRVRIISVPRNLNFATSANVAFAESIGSTVVFLDNDTEVLDDWLTPLLEGLADPATLGCQALLLNPDASVQCAGWAFLGGAALPSHLLANHPVDDARRAAPIRLRAVAASALAMRAADVVALRGFDPAYVNGFEDVDLCLRAVDGGDARFAVVTESRVVHHRRRPLARYYDRGQANRRAWMERWGDSPPPSDLGILDELGYEIVHVHPGEPVEGPRDVRIPQPVVGRPARTVPAGPAEGEPSLRWALKTGVPLRTHEQTGDLELAERLADALRDLGQDVVVDRLEANQRLSGYLDDVAVAVRGDVPLVDEPGRVNLCWLLDPTLVLDAAEARRYHASVASVSGRPELVDPTLPRPDQTTDLHPSDVDATARLMLRAAVELRLALPWRQEPS